MGEDIVDCDAAGDDEEYRVRVTVTKRGGRAEVDFSGTSRQARTCINATPLDAKTTVGIALQVPLRPGGLVHLGERCAPIDLVLPEGTVVSALPPDGAVFAYWEQSQAMLSAVLRALAQAVGERAIAGDRGSADIHNANGMRPDGTPWISAAQVGGEIGPFGANRHGDADSQMLSYQANGIGSAVEAIESEVAVVVLRHEFVARHRAAPGYNRGGAVDAARHAVADPAEHHLMSLRYKRAARVRRPRRRRRPHRRHLDLGSRTRSRVHDARHPGSRRGGHLDPETNAPTPDGVYRYPYRVRSGTRRPDALLRYVNTAAAAGATRSSASPSGSCATSATATSRSRAPQPTTVSS